MVQQALQMPSSVLVVDDEPIVLQVFSRFLNEKGLQTRTASNAEEALKLLSEGGIACVLADKNMPGMDGIEMLRRVREAQPHCAFIVMTGYASTESAIEALRLGAVDYLQKPFDDLDDVARRIEDAIQQVRTEIERSTTMARLGLFDDPEKSVVRKEDSEPGAPIQILEARVRQATEDLRARCLQLLSRLVASKSAGREVLLSGERILDEVRSAQKANHSDELGRIERLLEEHLALARHAQSR
ncbi:MAG TPA: response regulator [Myxococcales bacterium]|jgi:CheY-like chemotaxis protein|nr:response regulator [Myxococcales bacterium]